MAEPSRSPASGPKPGGLRWVPRVVAGSLLVLQMAAPVVPDRGPRGQTERSSERLASTQVQQSVGGVTEPSTRPIVPSVVSALGPGQSMAQDDVPGLSLPPKPPPADFASASPEYSAVSPAEREELGLILDSMLISQERDTDLPFEERIGQVDDPRVLEIMRDIDDTLGGGIQWPDVYVTGGMSDVNLLGFHSPDLSEADWYDLSDPTDGDHTFQESAFGIHLSSSMVESEFQTGSPGAVSVKQVLVHELQHSMSVDNGRELSAAADRSGNPYEFASTTASEGRASLSMLLYAEMEQRAEAGGPRLNELSKGDRQEVVQGVLQQYLVPVVSPPQDLAAERLLGGRSGAPLSSRSGKRGLERRRRRAYHRLCDGP